MKTVLAMIVAIAGMASAADASGSTLRTLDAPRAPLAAHACQRTDSEGFCGLALPRPARIHVSAPATLDENGRVQLNRLIASLR